MWNTEFIKGKIDVADMLYSYEIINDIQYNELKKQGYTDDYFFIKGRLCRLTMNYIDIGENMKTFDKFGNSTEITFEYNYRKDRRQFVNWLNL